MATAFGQRIREHAKEKGLSISELQRRAGLGNSTIRNILSGQSKHPSAENMMAIADVLECSLQELMYGKDSAQAKEAETSISFEHPELCQQCLATVLRLIAEKQHNLSFDQVLNCVREVYLYSVEHSPDATLDEGFAKWFVGRIL